MFVNLDKLVSFGKSFKMCISFLTKLIVNMIIFDTILLFYRIVCSVINAYTK